MTQKERKKTKKEKDKDLLLKDLCMRLPYSLKCCDFCYNDEGDIINTIETLECIYPSTMEYKYKDIDAKHDIERIKPYLRPMSSMTDEEKVEIQDLYHKNTQEVFKDPSEIRGYRFYDISVVDWLNKHHFDYRGLIPMRLALPAPEDMYKIRTIWNSKTTQQNNSKPN